MFNTRDFGKKSKPEASYEITMSWIPGTVLLIIILVAVFRLVRSRGKERIKITA